MPLYALQKYKTSQACVVTSDIMSLVVTRIVMLIYGVILSTF